MPATAATVQDALGVGGGAVDLNAACSGFVYGLVTAGGLVATGLERVLLIGADDHEPHRRLGRPRHGDPLRRRRRRASCSTAVERGRAHLLGCDLGSDGTARPPADRRPRRAPSRMDGREVFRRAVRVMVDSASAHARPRPGSPTDDVALVVPHQANLRIIDAVGQRLGISIRRRSSSSSTSTGNTSAASIPLALADADRRRSPAGRRPGAAVGLRCRHELGQRRRPVGPALGEAAS